MGANYDTIAERFRASGINKAAIIDDAFEIPNPTTEQKEEFWAVVEGSEELKAALFVLGMTFANEHDVSDLVVSDLWKITGEKGLVQNACKSTLFRDALQRVDDLERLCDCLRAAGIDDIQKLDGSSDCPPAPDTPLIFLDFSLDGHAPTFTEKDLENPDKLKELVSNRDVPDKSLKWAERIWNESGTNKPFLVLISDHPEAAPFKDKFLQESHVLGGLFGFLPKREFGNVDSVLLRLASWGIGNKDCQTIQRFVASAVLSVETVAKNFQDFVSKLDVHDYSHIYQMALADEGHPLGDYMVWLFESILGYQFRDYDKLRDEQRLLNGLRFDRCLPCERSTVGQTLTQAYWQAQTTPADELGAHPWGGDESSPVFAMGDLFIKDVNSPAYVVVNAPCDLRFIPGAGSRKWKPYLSLILIAGQIDPIETSSVGGDATTDFFELEGHSYKIVWDVKQARAVTNKESFKFFSEGGYRRRGLLRPIFAFEIKSRFLENLSRFGTPVTPPRAQTSSITVLTKNAGEYSESEAIDNGCIIFSRAGKTNFLLTTKAVDLLYYAAREYHQKTTASLQKGICSLETMKDHDVAKLAKKKEELKTQLEAPPNILSWLALAEIPEKLPELGGKPRNIDTGSVSFSVIYAETGRQSAGTTAIVLVVHASGNKSAISGENDGYEGKRDNLS